MPPGTLRFIVSRSPSSIVTLLKASLICWWENGICILMVSFQPTSGHLAKSIHLCLPGQPGVYTKLTRSKRDVRIACFWSVSFTNYSSTLHGGSIVRTQRVKMSFREDFSDLIILVSLTAAHLCQRVDILNRVMVPVGWVCLAWTWWQLR